LKLEPNDVPVTVMHSAYDVTTTTQKSVSTSRQFHPDLGHNAVSREHA
jgi:hypothetical protein